MVSESKTANTKKSANYNMKKSKIQWGKKYRSRFENNINGWAEKIYAESISEKKHMLKWIVLIGIITEASTFSKIWN